MQYREPCVGIRPPKGVRGTECKTRTEVEKIVTSPQQECVCACVAKGGARGGEDSPFFRAGRMVSSRSSEVRGAMAASQLLSLLLSRTSTRARALAHSSPSLLRQK